MGTFSVEVQIRRPGAASETWAPVKCLVDTGAAFCQFPRPQLSSLGITPERSVPVVLADGTTKDQPAALLEIRYDALTAFTLVLFAGENGLHFSARMRSRDWALSWTPPEGCSGRAASRSRRRTSSSF